MPTDRSNGNLHKWSFFLQRTRLPPYTSRTQKKKRPIFDHRLCFFCVVATKKLWPHITKTPFWCTSEIIPLRNASGRGSRQRGCVVQHYQLMVRVPLRLSMVVLPDSVSALSTKHETTGREDWDPTARQNTAWYGKSRTHPRALTRPRPRAHARNQLRFEKSIRQEPVDRLLHMTAQDMILFRNGVRRDEQTERVLAFYASFIPNRRATNTIHPREHGHTGTDAATRPCPRAHTRPRAHARPMR